MLTTLSVVVPAYNEESNLVRTVLEADGVLSNCAVEYLEWVLVDDGSTDNTWPKIVDLTHLLPNVIPLRHKANRGLGAAVWTGMQGVSSEWCVWLPADGQFDPQALVDMARLAGESDLVLLMREEDKRPWARRLLTVALYGGMRLLLGFDPFGYSGIFLVRHHILQNIPFYGTTAVQNYAVVVHCQKKGYRIRRTRTIVRPRMSGRSKVTNLRTMFKTLFEIIRLRLRVSFSTGAHSAQVGKGT